MVLNKILLLLIINILSTMLLTQCAHDHTPGPLQDSRRLIIIVIDGPRYTETWGDELKLKKGTTDIDVVAADNTGIYFTEERLKMKSYFVVGATYGTANKLFKLDKNFNEVFDKDYKKELKGYDFHSFQMLDKDLFLFATDYSKKEKMFKVYASKIDRNSGDLIGDFTEFGSYQLESKRDNYDMKVSSIRNGKSFLSARIVRANKYISIKREAHSN